MLNSKEIIRAACFDKTGPLATNSPEERETTMKITIKSIYNAIGKGGLSALKKQNKEAGELFEDNKDLLRSKSLKKMTEEEFTSMLKGADMDITKEIRGNVVKEVVDLNEVIGFLNFIEMQTKEEKGESETMFKGMPKENNTEIKLNEDLKVEKAVKDTKDLEKYIDRSRRSSGEEYTKDIAVPSIRKVEEQKKQSSISVQELLEALRCSPHEYIVEGITDIKVLPLKKKVVIE